MATAIHPDRSKRAIERAIHQALEFYLHSDFQPDVRILDAAYPKEK